MKRDNILSTIKETPVVTQKIMVPYGLKGEVTSIKSGNYFITDVVAPTIKTEKGEQKITLMQNGIRKENPHKEKKNPNKPLITGQRVVDTLFPIARGGVAAVPGPFGSGKQ